MALRMAENQAASRGELCEGFIGYDPSHPAASGKGGASLELKALKSSFVPLLADGQSVVGAVLPAMQDAPA